MAILGTMYTAIALALVPVFVRISEVGPIATAFYRFFLSFPFLLTWMIVDQLQEPSPKNPSSLKEYLLILGAGSFLALDITLWHWSILYTSVLNATLLNNLTTIFVALGSWLFLKQPINRATKQGIALALTGSVILVGYNFKVDMAHLWGDVLALISAFFFTAFIINL
jgi:drug/metabolite transporter (DMT)-like permease